MKFSMNGFRLRLSEDVKGLRDIVKNVVSGEFFDEEELINAMNSVIRYSNSLNCVYRNDDPDFVDMSDLEIEHLKKVDDDG